MYVCVQHNLVCWCWCLFFWGDYSWKPSTGWPSGPMLSAKGTCRPKSCCIHKLQYIRTSTRCTTDTINHYQWFLHYILHSDHVAHLCTRRNSCCFLSTEEFSGCLCGAPHTHTHKHIQLDIEHCFVAAWQCSAAACHACFVLCDAVLCAYSHNNANAPTMATDCVR